MGVEAVDHVEKFCVFGSLHGKVGRASAAENHDVEPVFPFRGVRNVCDFRRFCRNLHAFGIPAREDDFEFHVGILAHGGFNAPA